MVSRPKNLQFQTLFDDEKQQLFQNDMSFGNNLNDSAWDLDRSTPMGTLKNLIRHINTPRSSTDLTIAKALVLRVEDQIKSLYENINRPDSEAKYQMARVMVFTDPRHFWIPEPKRQDDPAIGFYPLVKYVYRDKVGVGLKPGDVVEVQFNNPRAQFSSHLETGIILSIEGHIQNKYVLQEAQKCLSQLPETNQTPPDPCETVSRLGDVAPVMSAPMTTESGQIQIAPAPPVRNLYVTSPYNLNRTHPVTGRVRPHRGTDFRAPIREPIFAAFDGVATLRTNRGGPTKGYGYYVFIKHTAYSTQSNLSPSPFFTLYAHLENHETAGRIKNGQKVKRGQCIGFSGGSGIGSGAHLHFEYCISPSSPFNSSGKKDPMVHFINKPFYQSGE